MDTTPQAARYTGPPPDRLHRDYARAGRVDPDAPVHATGEVVIEAPPERVWSVLSDVRGWPSIRADIHDVEATGPAAPDASFTWATAGIRLTSRFGLVERPHRLTWVTHAPGIALVHCYELTSHGPGHTRLWAEESQAAPDLPDIDSDALAARIATWLAGIRTVATSVAR